VSVVSVRKDGDAVGLSSIDGSFSSLYIYSYARPSVRRLVITFSSPITCRLVTPSGQRQAPGRLAGVEGSRAEWDRPG